MEAGQTIHVLRASHSARPTQYSDEIPSCPSGRMGSLSVTRSVLAVVSEKTDQLIVCSVNIMTALGRFLNGPPMSGVFRIRFHTLWYQQSAWLLKDCSDTFRSKAKFAM